MRSHRLLILLLLLLISVACGEAEPEPTPTPQLSAEAIAGQEIFARECGACHSIAPDNVVVGPSMAGIATRAETRVEGQDAYAYLLTSVLKPDAYMVDGFENLMPSTLGRTLTGEELDAVIAYLLTLE